MVPYLSNSILSLLSIGWLLRISFLVTNIYEVPVPALWTRIDLMRIRIQFQIQGSDDQKLMRIRTHNPDPYNT